MFIKPFNIFFLYHNQRTKKTMLLFYYKQLITDTAWEQREADTELESSLQKHFHMILTLNAQLIEMSSLKNIAGTSKICY